MPRLGWFALSIIIGMQAGTIFKPLGEVGVTRVADWVDLLTPYAVLGTAAAILLRAGATRAQWVWFGVGGGTGKGLHISANSVSNVADAVVAHASVVHLWDEVVSHVIWYSGLFIVVVVIGWTLRAVSFRVGAARPGGRRAGGDHLGQQLHRRRATGAGVGLPRGAHGPRGAVGVRHR